MAHVIKLNEIIPGKLYQRSQFMTFPWNTKLEMLNRYDIGMVVNLWARPDPELHAKSGLIYLHWPIGGGERPRLSDAMIELIDQALWDGVKVLIHCEAGVNRSIWLSAKVKARHQLTGGIQAFNSILDLVTRTKVRSGLMSDLAATDYARLV